MSLQQVDETIFRLIHLDLHAQWLDPIFWVISTSGLGYVQVLVVLLSPFSRWKQVSELSGWSKYKDIWKQLDLPLRELLVVIPLSGLMFAGVIKKLVERDRPSRLEYAMPQEGFFFSSFPSGHASTSFAIAFVLLLWASRSGKWKIAYTALCWATLVGYSRVYRGVHWPSDVLAGCLLGALGAVLVHFYFHRSTKLSNAV